MPPTTVNVIATKPFEHGDHNYLPGDRLDVIPMDAIGLAKRRVVTLTKKRRPDVFAREIVLQKGPEVEDETIEPLEDLPEPEPEPEPEPVPEEPTPPKKTAKARTYKRRDIQAEEPATSIVLD